MPTAKGDTDKRTVMGLHRDLAPIKVAAAGILELGDDEFRSGGGNVEADADRPARRRKDRPGND